MTSIYSNFVTNIAFPALENFSRRKVYSRFVEVDKSQWYTRKQLDEIQSEKLNRLIKHAYDNVPFYRKIFKKRGLAPKNISTPKDLKLLPIITKQDIMLAGESLLANNRDKIFHYKDSTSGSTGFPLSFLGDYVSRDFSTAYTLRGYSWTGYHLGDWNCTLSGRHNYDFATKIYNLLRRSITFSAFDIDNQYPNMITTILAHKPTLLAGYAQSIVKLALKTAQNNSSVTIPAVVTTSEMLYPKNRILIQKTFSSQVYDRYGSREIGSVSQECEYHYGQHINDESLIVEYVPTKLGKRIIITHLEKYAMPLLRYDTGDLGEPDYSPCPCGRNLSKLTNLGGRASDFITLPSGRLISFLYFNYTLEQTGDLISQFQIKYYARRPEIIVEIVPRGNMSSSSQKELIERLYHEIDHRIPIKIKFVSVIPLSSGGKQKIVEVINE